jgi:hypothetical protein
LTPPADRERTIAHLASTVLNECGHVSRHLDALADAINTGDEASILHNFRHGANHLAEAIEHARKLSDELGEFDPAIGAETDQLAAVTRDYDRGFSEIRAKLAREMGSVNGPLDY